MAPKENFMRPYTNFHEDSKYKNSKKMKEFESPLKMLVGFVKENILQNWIHFFILILASCGNLSIAP